MQNHSVQMSLKYNFLLRPPFFCLFLPPPYNQPDVLRTQPYTGQNKSRKNIFPSWITMQTHNPTRDSDTGVFTNCFSYLPKFSVSGLTRYIRFLSVCSGCNRSKFTCYHGEGKKKKDMISYWRKPSGTVAILQAIWRIHTFIPPTWEKQRWRMLAFSFFTARVNLCLLRFSPQNSLLEDHKHTYAQSKRLWQYTYWSITILYPGFLTNPGVNILTVSTCLSCTTSYRVLRRSFFHLGRLLEFYQQAQLARVSLVSTGQVVWTIHKLKDPLWPSHFGSPFKSCLISCSQHILPAMTEQPNNSTKNCRGPTQCVPSLWPLLF